MYDSSNSTYKQQIKTAASLDTLTVLARSRLRVQKLKGPAVMIGRRRQKAEAREEINMIKRQSRTIMESDAHLSFVYF